MQKSTIDLLALIGRDVTLRKHAARDGGEYVGACPFCAGNHGNGREADRLCVWPKAKTPRWWCRNCERQGDAIDYVRERDKLGYTDALARLGLTQAPASDLLASTLIMPAHDPVTPPSDIWQARAVTFCQESEDRLWTPEGARALTWLRDARGLTTETIRAASLGYNPVDVWDDRAVWGLPPETGDNGKPKRVWLPRGVVIPWAIGGHLWRVNIRRPVGEPKYIGPAGSGNALYRADTLASGWPAVLVEGELDALTIDQHAGGVASAVATGSTAGARRARWLAELALCSTILVAFDGDPAGEEAARYWLEVLANARRWRTYYGKDANGLAAAGGDVRGWVLAGLGAANEVSGLAGADIP